MALSSGSGPRGAAGPRLRTVFLMVFLVVVVFFAGIAERYDGGRRRVWLESSRACGVVTHGALPRSKPPPPVRERPGAQQLRRTARVGHRRPGALLARGRSGPRVGVDRAVLAGHGHLEWAALDHVVDRRPDELRRHGAPPRPRPGPRGARRGARGRTRRSAHLRRAARRRRPLRGGTARDRRGPG